MNERPVGQPDGIFESPERAVRLEVREVINPSGMGAVGG
jgi:hypothetical protein